MKIWSATLCLIGLLLAEGFSTAFGSPTAIAAQGTGAGSTPCSDVDLTIVQVEIARSEGSVALVPTVQNRCNGKTVRGTSIRVESGAGQKVLEQGALGSGFGQGTLRLAPLTVAAGPIGRPLRLTLTIGPRNLVPEEDEGNNQCIVTLVGGLRSLILRCP